jgi:hypothetical protein
MTRKQAGKKTAKPKSSPATTPPGVGGEGNREADRHYREDATRFARSGRVKDAADEAETALENEPEATELHEAEERGRAPGRD